MVGRKDGEKMSKNVEVRYECNFRFYIKFEQAFACARFQLIDLAHPLDPIGWAEIEFDQIGKLL